MTWTRDFLFTGIQSNVAPGSTGGNSGDITLEANSILMKDLAHLETSRTDSDRNGGNITGNAGKSEH